ncbi:hypothetical protein [Streptomyces sp. NPDC051183]|uniref:hypothetical protein n=1 Tax=Streptomyces sp. NPDC051183 TaxID=3155165 RepID=UPI0034343ECB
MLAACSDGGEAEGRPSPTQASPATSASGSGSGSGRPSASPSATAGATAPLVPALDEAKQPKNAAEARASLGRIIADQDVFGPDVTRRVPFESDSRLWPVLGQDCAWQTSGLPADVLATSTRHFQIAPKEGQGRLKLDVTVTVHRNREESGWETARAMEEVLRCPDQRLRANEEVKGLWGGALYLGEQMNGWTEDSFNEVGKYVGEEGGGPYHYIWNQAQFGPVTVAVTGKGAAGFTTETINSLVVQGTSRMMLNAKQEFGKAAG